MRTLLKHLPSHILSLYNIIDAMRVDFLLDQESNVNHNDFDKLPREKNKRKLNLQS